MPLVGYLKTSDPNRISTISANDERTSMRKKLLLPGDTQPVGMDVYTRTYVADCSEHIGGVSVPVLLKRYDPEKKWKAIGTARCCPLCWKILVGVDGTKEPPTQKQYPNGEPISQRRAAAIEKTEKKKARKSRNLATSFNMARLLLWAEELGDWFDIYQVMEKFGVTRTKAHTMLDLAVKVDSLEVIVRRGKAQRTTYRVSQEKAS